MGRYRWFGRARVFELGSAAAVQPPSFPFFCLGHLLLHLSSPAQDPATVGSWAGGGAAVFGWCPTPLHLTPKNPTPAQPATPSRCVAGASPASPFSASLCSGSGARADMPSEKGGNRVFFCFVCSQRERERWGGRCSGHPQNSPPDSSFFYFFIFFCCFVKYLTPDITPIWLSLIDWLPIITQWFRQDNFRFII